MDDRERRIVDVILALGPGEVTTYGDIADVAGYPKRARLVGRILATTDLDVPWWRVVNVTGRLVPGHEREQAQLLRAEGVVVRGWTGEVGADRTVHPSPGGGGAAAALTCTNASRMLASASRIVGASSPSRSPSPSTRQATASMASAGTAQVGRVGRQMDRSQLVQAHHVVGDHDLDRQRGQVGTAPRAAPLGPRRAPTRRRSRTGPRRFHLPRALPYRRQLRRSGGDPHPTTPTGRARQIRAIGSMLMIATAHRPTTSALSAGQRIRFRLRSCSAWTSRRAPQPDWEANPLHRSEQP